MFEFFKELLGLGKEVVKLKNKRDATHVIRITTKVLKAISEDDITSINSSIDELLRTPAKTKNVKTGE